ncbi:MAG: hypothetical protein CVV32_06380 [Methanomicrobiales archaeon HGW-Methanomicrobiales-3]|jgi:hypothetical protein|nr:MAG: hypothetical protein CVV32_06380 [Methanomicrobiales archaeon HGW-Methanomicrobiales-3]
MRKFSWETKLALVLVAISLCIYAGKFLFLKNPGDTANYIFNALGFLPINVLLVTIVLNKLLVMRAKSERMQKINMVIGTFFAEVGNDLIKIIVPGNPAISRLNTATPAGGKWDTHEFAELRRELAANPGTVDIAKIDMDALYAFLCSRRDFLLRLLENPVLLEHESFTDLLRAVFHLTEELRHRCGISDLPDSDYTHLKGDIGRVNERLVLQWLDYMEYLDTNYPYLYSLEMRTNPFDAHASPVVR